MACNVRLVPLVDGDPGQSDSTLTPGSDGQRAVVKILDLGLALLADDGHVATVAVDPAQLVAVVATLQTFCTAAGSHCVWLKALMKSARNCRRVFALG